MRALTAIMPTNGVSNEVFLGYGGYRRGEFLYVPFIGGANVALEMFRTTRPDLRMAVFYRQGSPSGDFVAIHAPKGEA